MNGTDLLAEFRSTRAEAAFNQLVRRYTNFVYSIAKRRVADATLAEEVTQLVCIRLAKAPPKLDSEAQVLAWLHRTTVHVSIDLWRSETRRRAREQHAVAMQPDPTEDVAWSKLGPIVDEALNELNEADRQAILLRFFEQKTMADLGRAFGVSEDAAKMRVSRALQRLRTQLSGLGVTCSAVLLGTLLFERSVQAAPSGLAATLAAIKISAPTGLAASLASLLLQAPRLKLLAGIAAAVLVGGAAFLLLHATSGTPGPGNKAADSAGSAEENELSGAAVVPANSNVNSAGEATDPDPLRMLQAAARARQRIASGIMEFNVFTRGNVTRADATNQFRLKIQFEDGRCWAESFTTEYSYVTPIPGGPEAEAITKRADQMTREEAVRVGLLQPFPSHHTAFYDGQAVTDYWEDGSPHPRTTVDKPGRSSIFIFDPRILGISTTLFVESGIDACLGFREAKSIHLVGNDSVDGTPAWHIKLQNKYDSTLDYWVDVLHPFRILKLEVNGNVALSRFSDTDPKDPLPIEIRNIDYRNGVPRYETRIVRLSAQYDASIASACWTLDGLHMKVGTVVTDVRNHRMLGYWTGSGLSEFLPDKKQPAQTGPDRAQLLSLLDNEPASPAAFDAAQWLLLNSPDGPDVEKAADAMIHDYIQRPDLVKLAGELERLRHNCSSNLLQAMLDLNPHPDVRGNACLALATIRKDAAEFGKNKQATAEAEKLYQRVIAEFPQVKQRGYSLAKLAEPELSEIRRLFLGKVAPEIVGYDLNGHPLKLSEYRGNVVTLLFWSALCPIEQESRDFHRLVDQMDGKPFVLLGIHADDNTEKARAAAEKYKMNWASFQDAREGPISKAYNINSWPTVYVLDRQGVIRYRGLRFGSEIAKAASELLKE